MKIEHDTPEAIAITDKAARDLLASEKAFQVKHTPAPWQIIDREFLDDGSVYPCHVVGGNSKLMACYLEGRESAELAIPNPDSFWAINRAESANARLIAAALETAAEREAQVQIFKEIFA